MFRMLHQGTDFTTDSIMANRIFSICLLTVLFTLFLLILSLGYINPSMYSCSSSCDFKNSGENVPQILYNEPNGNLAIERYVGEVSVNGYTNAYSNFFPDVNDIQIIDETNDFPDPNKKVPPDKKKKMDSADQEALTSVKMALKFKQKNNNEKAHKLFQHAVDLSPNHPDVLLHYGEFLESSEDYISADHLYSRALILRPQDSRALENRRRTLPVVTQLDDNSLEKIDAKRVALIELNKKDLILKELKKEMYFKHIHHTVAIEGNTMTLEETKKVIETKRAVGDKSILEHDEILGIESALRYINQTLLNKNDDITVADILQIHKRVMERADPVNAGAFRKSQVFVGGHMPPPASDLEDLMNDFVSMLQAPHVRNMHPIQVSALAHLKLVLIHPFLDGNGRTARLLMNLCLMRHGFPPIIIRKEDRSEYFKFIPMANEGDSRPFYRFIARATEDTIDDFLKGYELKHEWLRALESSSSITNVIAL